MSSSASILKRVEHAPCDGRAPIRYRIERVDKPLIDEAVAFMVEHFLPNENIVTALGIHLDEEAIEEARSIWRNPLSEEISIAAFLEDDHGNRGDMISCNVLHLVEKDHPETSGEFGKNWTRILQTLEDVEVKGDVFERYNCSAYIHAMGLSVSSAYEGRGIATEMLRARGAICRTTDTPVSATVFTGVSSQKAAARCGYETVSELDLTTYRINGEIVYSNPKWPVIKWMAKRYY